MNQSLPNHQPRATAQQEDSPSELDRLLRQPYSPREAMFGAKFDRMVRIAEYMAGGRTTVPKHLQDNVSDCMAIVMQAMNWNADPFAVAQKTHLVNGVLGYESQLIGAILNSSGAIVEPALREEYFGDWSRVIGNYKELDSKFKEADGTPKKFRRLASTLEDERGVGIRMWATLTGETEPRKIELLLTQAGVRNSTLWADDPQQQLFYLAQKRWARKYAPGVILGLYSPDELPGYSEDDEGDGSPFGSPAPAPRAAVARKPRQAAATEPSPPPAATEHGDQPARTEGVSAEEKQAAAGPAPTDAPKPSPAPQATQAPSATPAATKAPASAPAADGKMAGEGEIAYLKKKAEGLGKTLDQVAESLGMNGLIFEAGKLSKEDFDTIRAELMKLGA